jgi:mono/diheme cytochrome c family protein
LKFRSKILLFIHLRGEIQMIAKAIFVGLLAAVCSAALYFVLSAPKAVTPNPLGALIADTINGRAVYLAAGCGGCHSAPQSSQVDNLILSGGQHFETPFGRFYAPNISMSVKNGIGRWSFADFERAVRQGVSPDGAHYFPVFPYTAYQHMRDQDIVDLWGYWQSFPVADTKNQAHDLPLFLGFRRNIGLWKRMFMMQDWAISGDLNPDEQKGRYLAEALGHCGECHTPRNAFGGLQRAQWLAGTKNPVGKGHIPNITPASLDWSVEEISEYLSSGFTPEFDTVGGHMVLVVENLAQLNPQDRNAIAQYLKAVPAVGVPQ